MKKLFLLFLFCNLAISSFALGVGDLFIQGSRFWQNNVFVNLLKQDKIFADFVFNLTEHKDINDKIFAFHLPIGTKLSIFNFTLDPFWYPNTSGDAYAYGGSLKIESLFRSDYVNNNYASGYFKASFANQRADISRGGTPNKENFKQLVFEGGLNIDFANLYIFNINGNIFTYPDEVKDITSFGGIMNQNDLADLGTIDYILAFPHFSAGGGITWISRENNTKTSLSYRYINYEHDLIAHSVMIQTLIPISENLLAKLIYNHLFETHHHNKDLFGIGLNYLF